jgi:excisionase family DNA binding protein
MTSQKHVVTVEIPQTFIDAVSDAVARGVKSAMAEQLAAASTHANSEAVAPAAEPDENILLSIKRVAKLLSLSERTVYRLESEGGMPKAKRLGVNVRWSCEELQAWVRAGCPSIAG